jgi:glycosyltransferase involved in cell wall biosynthesis
MPGRTPLTVVVPCFDEARRLPVEAFREALRSAPWLSLHFVDDGSRDGTAQVLEAVRRGFEDRVSITRMERNAGKGEAVRAGMRKATAGSAAYVGYADADLATPLDALAEMADLLDLRPELLLVMGARVKTLGRSIDRRRTRHYLGRVIATFTSRTLGLPVYDTQCGAKLFRAGPVVTALFEEPFSTRWLFDVELLARLLRLHRQGVLPHPASIVLEHPLARWSDVPGSKVKPMDFFRALFGLRRIRRRYLRGDS